MKYFVYLLSTLFFTSALAACSQQTTEVNESEAEGAAVIEKKKEEHDLHASSWSYTGEQGPKSWGTLDQAYAACVNGSEQSPVNIESSQVKTDEKIENVITQYKPTTLSLINNGHTVQINDASGDNKIILAGTEYRLIQFHFHTPSEHQFNGRQYAMELHLVHQNANDELAVLGLMIQEGANNENLQSVWDALPKEKTEEEVAISESIDLEALLPQVQTFVYYKGSLTTPPCTEDVQWVILEQPIEMSKEQVDIFRGIFPDNHRPVQPLNEREIITN